MNNTKIHSTPASQIITTLRSQRFNHCTEIYTRLREKMTAEFRRELGVGGNPRPLTTSRYVHCVWKNMLPATTNHSHNAPYSNNIIYSPCWRPSNIFCNFS